LGLERGPLSLVIG